MVQLKGCFLAMHLWPVYITKPPGADFPNHKTVRLNNIISSLPALKLYESMIQLQKLRKIGYSWKARSKIVPMENDEFSKAMKWAIGSPFCMPPVHSSATPMPSQLFHSTLISSNILLPTPEQDINSCSLHILHEEANILFVSAVWQVSVK